MQGSYITSTAQMVNYGKLKDILLNVNPGHGKARTKIKEVDEVDFTNHKELDIKTSEKKKDLDMPWMGL